MLFLGLLISLTLTGSAMGFSAKSVLKAEWIKLDPSRTITPRRAGHVAFTVDSRVFVFGGYVEVDDDGGTMKRFVTNDLWEWTGEGWTEWEPQTDILPGPRLATAAAVLNGSPYVLGGWDPQTEGTGGVILDRVHKLNIKSGKWTELAETTPDGPTSRHVVLTLPDSKRALLHNHRCTDHVWILHGETDTFHKQPTTGTAPSSRGLHAATMAGKTAVIFGGAAQNGIMSNEVFLLDTETWEWTPVKFQSTSGSSCPSPRAGASMCSYSDCCVLLFGGAETRDTGLNPRGDVWALHLDASSGEGQWELLIDDSSDTAEYTNTPPPRNAASLTRISTIQDRDGLCFLLTGGWAPFRQTWDDCFVLCVSSEDK